MAFSVAAALAPHDARAGAAPAREAQPVDVSTDAGARAPAREAQPVDVSTDAGARAPAREAERLAASGRCADALPLLAEVTAADPTDVRAVLLTGQCLIRLRRYDEAVVALEKARGLDPSVSEVDLSLGIARYHRGDVEGAGAALATARTRGTARAQLDFYEGLVMLQRQEARAAATALERAARSEPQSVEPSASYYAGLAWREAGDADASRVSLERVVTGWPGTSWAEAAQRALASDATSLPRSWLRLEAGAEYDTNAVLHGGGTSLPAEIGSQSDLRAVWSAELGSELWRDGAWTAGGRATYYGNQHEDVYEFNVHYPGVSFWLDRQLGDSDLLRAQADFAYGWVYNDPYVATWTLTPSWQHTFGDRLGTTRLFGEVVWANFLFPEEDVIDAAADGRCPAGLGVCGPLGLNEKQARNRDGWAPGVGIEHVWPLALPATDLTAGYTFQRQRSRGAEWSGQSHEFRLGTHSSLPWGVSLDLSASYTYRPYRSRSTYPTQRWLDASIVAGNAAGDGFARPYELRGPRRSEDVGMVEISLEKQLGPWLAASIRYAYVNNHSNTDVFDYERHLVGAYLVLHLHD